MPKYKIRVNYEVDANMEITAENEEEAENKAYNEIYKHGEKNMTKILKRKYSISNKYTKKIK